MKIKILLLSSLCLIGTMYGQENAGVAIGTPLPDASAMLHVNSDTKGVLIPNVVLTDLNLKDPIATEAKESLLVYNKTAKLDAGKVVIAKGYYYWLTTTAPAGRWVRVLTSEDGSEILAGQIQESFVEETKVENNVTVGTGVFVYNPDKTKAGNTTAEGRVKLDIPKLVDENQTLTKFELKEKTMWLYSDGKWYDKELTPQQMADLNIEFFIKDSRELAMFYTDEKKVQHTFLVKDLLGADNPDIPAITKLIVNSSENGLNYTNDKGVAGDVNLTAVVKKLETTTSISVTDDVLSYKNEKGDVQGTNLRSVVREPWRVAETNEEATRNNQNIFVDGWVGIGLTAAEAKEAIKPDNRKTDEMLRVDGSIYARNSYYADYVFENYFTKATSSLKYDYNFKNLATVESFIKANYHLPGITPIAELEKSKDSGYLINVSELSIQLLEKVEELYLHAIDQNKLIEQQEARLQQIEVLLNIDKK